MSCDEGYRALFGSVVVDEIEVAYVEDAFDRLSLLTPSQPPSAGGRFVSHSLPAGRADRGVRQGWKCGLVSTISVY